VAMAGEIVADADVGCCCVFGIGEESAEVKSGSVNAVGLADCSAPTRRIDDADDGVSSMLILSDAGCGVLSSADVPAGDACVDACGMGENMSCGMRCVDDRRSYAYSYGTREEAESALDADAEEDALVMEDAVDSESDEECEGVEYAARL
jgi:hypothetical protein